MSLGVCLWSSLQSTDSGAGRDAVVLIDRTSSTDSFQHRL